jgi:multidrug resistance efflux pump
MKAVSSIVGSGRRMKRTAIIIGIICLVAVVAGLGFFWPFGDRSGALHLHGIVEIQEVRLGSKVGGRVEKVLVTEGKMVGKDEVLVVFEAPELRAQRDELEAELAKAKADLEKVSLSLPRDIEMAEAAAAAAKERWQKAEKGWRKEEIKMAKDDLDAAIADKRFADDEKVRVSDLFKKKSVSQSEYELALANETRAASKYAAARTKWDMMKAGGMKEDREAAKSEWQQAKSNYQKLVETKYATLTLAQRAVDVLRAKLERNAIDLKETEVRAYEECLVEVVSVRAGDIVTPNQPIVRVLRAADMWVKVFVPETDIGKIQLDREVDVTIDSYPGKRFKGMVIQVGTIAEFTPRNVQSKEERHYQVFPVKIRVDNPQGVFKAGMAAEVTVPPAVVP